MEEEEVDASTLALVRRLERDLLNFKNSVALTTAEQKRNWIEVSKDVEEIKEEAKNHVSLERYKNVERLVYGFVALILIGVVGGLLSLIIIKGGTP